MPDTERLEPVGDLWSLILRAFPKRGVTGVEALVAEQLPEAGAEGVTRLVTGLMNGSIDRLPVTTAAAIRTALTGPREEEATVMSAVETTGPPGDAGETEDQDLEAELAAGGYDAAAELAAGAYDEVLAEAREVLECPQCEHGFPDRGQLVDHQRSVHLTCGLCDHKPYTSQSGLKYHTDRCGVVAELPAGPPAEQVVRIHVDAGGLLDAGRTTFGHAADSASDEEPDEQESAPARLAAVPDENGEIRLAAVPGQDQRTVLPPLPSTPLTVFQAAGLRYDWEKAAGLRYDWEKHGEPVDDEAEAFAASSRALAKLGLKARKRVLEHLACRFITDAEVES